MAKITEASISLSENLVQITNRCHSELRSGLRVFGLSCGRSDDSRLQVELRMGDGDGTTFLPSGHFVPEDRNERMEARLVHNEIGEISSGSWRVRDLIPEQYVPPLYFLLTKFCSQIQFHSLLRVAFIDSTRLAEGIRFLQDRNDEQHFFNLGFVGTT